MRLIFGLVGLLVAVVVVGLLAKRQLQAVQLPVAGTSASQGAAGATPAEQSRQLQRQTSDEMKKALDAGLQRNRDAEGGR